MFALRLLKHVGKPGAVRASTINIVRSVSQNAQLPEQPIEGQTHFGYQTVNESEKEEKGNIRYVCSK